MKFSDYLEYDETSPSCLRWIKSSGRGSKVRPGDIAGSLCKLDNYWRLHALGGHLKVHRVVWELCGNYFIDGYFIDHIDGNRSNNKISNLRQIPPAENGRNRKMNDNNTTAKNGVCFSERIQPSGKYFSKYTAHVFVESGKKVQKSFSIQKYGDAAFDMACKWRDDMIKTLNEAGYGYTERHGIILRRVC